MDTSKLRFGQLIATGSAVALLITMFLPWYGVSDKFINYKFNAWESLELIDLLILAAVVVVIAVTVIMLADGKVPGQLSTVIFAAGTAALALVLFRLVFSPLDTDGSEVELSRKFGIYLSLIAAAGMAFGGYQLVQEDQKSS